MDTNPNLKQLQGRLSQIETNLLRTAHDGNLTMDLDGNRTILFSYIQSASVNGVIQAQKILDNAGSIQDARDALSQFAMSLVDPDFRTTTF